MLKCQSYGRSYGPNEIKVIWWSYGILVENIFRYVKYTWTALVYIDK